MKTTKKKKKNLPGKAMGSKKFINAGSGPEMPSVITDTKTYCKAIHFSNGL